jgi:hypothetical protein
MITHEYRLPNTDCLPSITDGSADHVTFPNLHFRLLLLLSNPIARALGHGERRMSNYQLNYLSRREKKKKQKTKKKQWPYTVNSVCGYK